MRKRKGEGRMEREEREFRVLGQNLTLQSIKHHFW